MAHSEAIERIKKEGSMKALRDSIDSLIHKLSNRNWEGIKSGNVYCRLDDACIDAKRIVGQIEDRLKALNELDGESV